MLVKLAILENASNIWFSGFYKLAVGKFVVFQIFNKKFYLISKSVTCLTQNCVAIFVWDAFASHTKTKKYFFVNAASYLEQNENFFATIRL